MLLGSLAITAGTERNGEALNLPKSLIELAPHSGQSSQLFYAPTAEMKITFELLRQDRYALY